MFFPPSQLQERFSKQCLLVACFFAFSFNHIIWTKYHFVLGQASFYFIALALLTSNFQLPRQTIIWVIIFLSYCVGSAAFMCIAGNGLCTARPYTATISIIFVFLTVQYVAASVVSNPSMRASIENAFVWSSWALVLSSIPNIWLIAQGESVQTPPYGLDFLSPFGFHSYVSNRLQGFTQEPSYFGMVIATLYPICFMRLNQKWSFSKFLLVTGLSICLGFSLSRVGIISCAITSTLILTMWPKRLFYFSILMVTMALLWSQFPQLQKGHLLSFSWVPFYGLLSLDGSSLVRFAHIVGAINVWNSNLLFGVGLGQSGFILNQYYPTWYSISSPEYVGWTAQARFGGVPSMSFLPKLLAEIGCIGAGLLIWWAKPLIYGGFKVFKDPNSNIFAFAFLGFLIASFGVDGYLYLSAWIIFGVLLGVARQSCEKHSG